MKTMIRAAALGAAALGTAALGAGALLAACGGSDAPAGDTGATPADQLALEAQTVLPPGQSGFVNAVGQAVGLLSGKPADYGKHIDDQRSLYWNFGAKPAALGTRPGKAETPLSGVEIYRDDYGVPIVYAGKVHDLWYGVGYAVAHDRLFLMDAVRRQAEGTMAELSGCGNVPADIQQRILGYTDAEYQQFYDRLSQDARDAVQGYVDGANAWREKARLNPLDLPAEYALLTTTPAPFTIKDVLAAGVYMTRFVASEGGNEFENIRTLKLLQQQYGSRGEALKAFQDLVWLDDPKALTSVPDAAFSNQDAPAGGREALLAQLADWAMNLPETIWKGDGTGNAALPAACASLSSADTDGGAPTAVAAAPPAQTAGLGTGAGRARLQPASVRARHQDRAGAAIRQIVLALQDLHARFHGGSHAYALGPGRTRDHGTLLLSGPQLGYGYPGLLVEFEIHLEGGPGAGYAARGVSVPLLPVVAIGYSGDVAWGLTTGYSKTIDSFIETICSSAQQSAGTCRANQYLDQEQWQDMDCRSETIKYRLAIAGIPLGPPNRSQTLEACRTVHGPIVARDEAAGVARSLQYAMWQHETDTIEGIRQWNQAHSYAEFLEGVRQVTWNENAVVATRDGHIAYFHPGRFLRRKADTDMRLPIPGGGAYDFGDPLPFEQLPQSVDPAQGYLANWNTKPAHGWLDGEGLGYSSRPAGPGQRVSSILDLLGSRNDWSYADLQAIDAQVGTTDPRAREYLPLIQAFRTALDAQLSDVQKAALDLMLGWDHRDYGPDISLDDPAAHDGPAATVFGEYVTALRDELFAPLKSLVIDDRGTADTADDLSVYGRLTDTGSHVFEVSVADNVALRVLDPASSGLSLQHDFTGGRKRDALMLAALDTALARLATSYNGGVALQPADLSKCQRVHPRSQLCSLTGVIGPGSNLLPGTSCVSMPYQDRGSWVHRVGYEKP